MIIKKTLLAAMAVVAVAAPAAAMAHDYGYGGWAPWAAHARAERVWRRDGLERGYAWAHPHQRFHDGRRFY